MKKFIPCTALSILLLSGCRVNTYEIKNAEIIGKHKTGTVFPNYYITFKKGNEKGQVEVQGYQDYSRMMVGQHINMWVSNQNSTLEEYQLNMGGK
jgi:hypothetical protein